MRAAGMQDVLARGVFALWSIRCVYSSGYEQDAALFNGVNDIFIGVCILAHNIFLA
jgi:hypothetical protein